MLRISKLTDYGTVVMTELARNPRGVVSATDLASRLDITPATVSKLLKLLSKGKLVHSYRGSEGGYQLAQLPEDISVAAIIDVLSAAAPALVAVVAVELSHTHTHTRAHTHACVRAHTLMNYRGRAGARQRGARCAARA